MSAVRTEPVETVRFNLGMTLQIKVKPHAFSSEFCSVFGEMNFYTPFLCVAYHHQDFFLTFQLKSVKVFKWKDT